MFNQKFNVSSVFLPDKPGNYKKTLRKSDDLINLVDILPTIIESTGNKIPKNFYKQLQYLFFEI